MHSAHTAYSRSHSSPYSPIPSAHSRIALGEGRGCAGAKRSDERVRTHVRSVRSDRRSGEQVELGKLRKRATGCYTYSLARLPTLSAARRPLPSGMGCMAASTCSTGLRILYALRARGRNPVNRCVGKCSTCWAVRCEGGCEGGCEMEDG